MSRWFRHYSGMMRDEKLVRAAVKAAQPIERVIWVWGALLESAAEINDGGRYDLDAGEAAYFLRCNDADIRSILSSLADIGRIVDGVVAKWSDRQFDSDTSRDRQRRYRERRAEADVREPDSDAENRKGDVTRPSPNGEMTLQEYRDRVQIEESKKPTALSETSSDPRVSTPNQRKKENYSPDFQAFWKAYPTDALMSKTKAFAAWKRLGEDARTEIMVSLPAFKAHCASKPDYRPVHAVRYITERRSEGFVQVASRASEMTFVAKDTPEWEAWQRVKKVQPVMSTEHHKEGWWFPSRWPQQQQEAAA